MSPRSSLLIVIGLAAVLLVSLREIGRRARQRFEVERNLASLASAQGEHHRRWHVYASKLGDRGDSATIMMFPDSGVIVTIDQADSSGWSAVGTHPRLGKVCRIYGGTAPHDPRITKPGDPACF